jgi:hypothetical protein
MFAWRSFKITFEQRVALMKPLSAPETEVLKHLPMTLDRGDRSQPQHYRAGNQELHVPSVPKIRGGQPSARDCDCFSRGVYQVSL